jgi:raffinose/stachyose/melibiose transport system permease protein
VSVIVFVHSWNNYLLPLVVLNRDALYPWPLGIMVYQGEFSTDWNLVLAFITLTILPAIIMFFAAQKHIVAGLMAGAANGMVRPCSCPTSEARWMRGAFEGARP